VNAQKLVEDFIRTEAEIDLIASSDAEEIANMLFIHLRANGWTAVPAASPEAINYATSTEKLQIDLADTNRMLLATQETLGNEQLKITLLENLASRLAYALEKLLEAQHALTDLGAGRRKDKADVFSLLESAHNAADLVMKDVKYA
jgi:hypothetical protein